MLVGERHSAWSKEDEVVGKNSVPGGRMLKWQVKPVERLVVGRIHNAWWKGEEVVGEIYSAYGPDDNVSVGSRVPTKKMQP